MARSDTFDRRPKAAVVHQIPTEVPKTTDWRAFSSCLELDPEMFYPDKGGDNGAPAKKVCRSCPVRNHCLEEALARNEGHGIWGGLSPEERSDLRRSRRRLDRYIAQADDEYELELVDLSA